jgi:hypothetical protein
MIPLIIVLWAAPLASPISVELKEKYGAAVVIDSVTVVIDRNGAYWIDRNGKLYGQFMKDNYSIRRVR